MKYLNKFLKVSSLILLSILWIYSIYCYVIFPNTIPVHFNFTGEVDRYGDKIILLILPIISSIIFYILGFANNFSLKNKSFLNKKNINENFLPFHLLFFNYLRCVIQVLFLTIVTSTHLIVFKKTDSLIPGFNFILLLLIIVPTAIYTYKALKSN